MSAFREFLAGLDAGTTGLGFYRVAVFGSTPSDYFKSSQINAL
jgi:hypothetical protein